MKNILHLVDDEKFVKFAYESFSKFEEVENTFRIVTDNNSLTKIDFPCQIEKSKDFYDAKEINSYDLLVIHFLDTKYYRLLKDKAIKVKILWIGWGGDYYWLIDTWPGFDLYKKKTANITFNVNKTFINHFLKSVKRFKRRKITKLVNRINYFAPVLYEDYLLIKKNNKKFSPQYTRWNYGNIEDNYIKDNDDFTISGNNIIIGNSATMTNNHLDVFEALANIDLDDKKVIIPLNYGDKAYGNIIEKAATIKFRNVENLREFLPYADYLNKIKSCGNVIMGHLRQQALGNIITLLYFGAKLFFFKESVTYKFFIKNNFKVFSLEELRQNPDLLNIQLSEETVKNHRIRLVELWGKDVNRKNTRNVISLVE